MPLQAQRACSLYRLPAAPTQAALEIGYATRGNQLADCDSARQLAVDTFAAEHKLADEAAKQIAKNHRPWWQLW